MPVADLDRHRYVSLVTFRKTGERVATAVWVVRDGDALLVTTGATSGKVKRIRNSGLVELQECNARGQVPAGAPVVEGVAEVLDDAGTLARLTELLRGKYRIAMRIMSLFGRDSVDGRVALRITDRS